MIIQEEEKMRISKLFISLLIGVSFCASMSTANAMISSSSMAIGNFRCLDYFSKAEKELGPQNNIHDSNSYEWYLIPAPTDQPLSILLWKGYTSTGLSRLFEDPKVLSIGIYDTHLYILKVIDRVSPEWLSRISTPEGVRVGMELEEVEEIYGVPDSVEKRSNMWTGENISYVYNSYDSNEKLRITARVTDHIVHSIYLSIDI